MVNYNNTLKLLNYIILRKYNWCAGNILPTTCKYIPLNVEEKTKIFKHSDLDILSTSNLGFLSCTPNIENVTD